MRLIRKTYRSSLFLWLLALSLGLRSLIAPGFMLNPNGEGPLGISITLCGSFNELAVFDDPHLVQGSHEHAEHTHVQTGQTHDHAESGGLFSNSCGLWSTSATSVPLITFHTDHLLQFGSADFSVEYSSPEIQNPYRLRQQPRAPPVSFII